MAARQAAAAVDRQYKQLRRQYELDKTRLEAEVRRSCAPGLLGPWGLGVWCGMAQGISCASIVPWALPGRGWRLRCIVS